MKPLPPSTLTLPCRALFRAALCFEHAGLRASPGAALSAIRTALSAMASQHPALPGPATTAAAAAAGAGAAAGAAPSSYGRTTTGALRGVVPGGSGGTGVGAAPGWPAASPGGRSAAQPSPRETPTAHHANAVPPTAGVSGLQGPAALAWAGPGGGGGIGAGAVRYDGGGGGGTPGQQGVSRAWGVGQLPHGAGGRGSEEMRLLQQEVSPGAGTWAYTHLIPALNAFGGENQAACCPAGTASQKPDPACSFTRNVCKKALAVETPVDDIASSIAQLQQLRAELALAHSQRQQGPYPSPPPPLGAALAPRGPAGHVSVDERELAAAVMMQAALVPQQVCLRAHCSVRLHTAKQQCHARPLTRGTVVQPCSRAWVSACCFLGIRAPIAFTTYRICISCLRTVAPYVAI